MMLLILGVQGHVFHWNWIVYSDGVTEELEDIQVQPLRIDSDDDGDHDQDHDNCNDKATSDDECERKTKDANVLDDFEQRDVIKGNGETEEEEEDNSQVQKSPAVPTPRMKTKSSNVKGIPGK